MVLPASTGAKAIVSAPRFALARSIASRRETSPAEKSPSLSSSRVSTTRHQRLHLIGSHIHRGTVDAIKGNTALVRHQLSRCGIVARIDRRTVRQQCDRRGRPAVVLQTGWIQPGSTPTWLPSTPWTMPLFAPF